MIGRLASWLDARTGFRRIRERALDEPLPPGTGWWFTLGSALLAVVAVQIATGAFLTLYYAPTPDHAYQSIQFIESTAPGRIVRGLHHYGASFVVVLLVLHALRVIVFGSYRPPRELTWLTGLALLGVMLAFALTGYLLPWDQRAYWATVVTINISRLAPVAGDAVAALLQGGASVGALTLTRWYSLHVIFLPAALAVLVVLHLAQIRAHGISGPVRPRTGQSTPFYPYHAARDASVAAGVLMLLGVMAWRGAAPLEAPADPTDATYVPRPEWYFLGLFQLLKYFPGSLEVIGAIILPALVVILLALLPWIDRGAGRDPRERRGVLTAVGVGLAGLVVLTFLGWQDRTRASRSGDEWTLKEIAGRTFVERSGCDRCHGDSGIADPIGTAAGRHPEWTAGHLVDPEMIAPGLREPVSALNEREAAAILSYVRRLAVSPFPEVAAATQVAAAVHARHCIGCHVIDGEGGSDGPELSRIGARHDEATLRRWISDPEAINPDAEMPSFARRLTPAELDAIAQYLARRR